MLGLQEVGKERYLKLNQRLCINNSGEVLIINIIENPILPYLCQITLIFINLT
jgi:hypothetical protein